MQPGEQPMPGAQPPAPNPSIPPQAPTQEQSSPQWQYANDDVPAGNFDQPGDLPAVSWTASEYVAHPKGTGWFGLFGIGVAVLVILVFFITHDILTVVLVAIAAIAFGAFAARNPHVLEYRIDNQGLTIAGKHYPYSVFKSFSVITDGPLNSLHFTPLKRFSTPIVVYYAESDEDRIVDALSSYLPLEQREHDMVDRVMKRMRF